MTEQEIKETAKLMEEGKLNLVDWLDNQLKEDMKNLGLDLQMTDYQTNNQNESIPISGTITFLKGESAKKAAERYRKKKEE